MISETVVRLREVCRTFQTPHGPVRALNACSFELHTGQFVAVRGPSGCGKSTLLALLSALDTPTSGALEIAGHQINPKDREGTANFRREHIGYLFQDAGLIDRMTVLDNVLLPLMYRKRQNARAIALDVLKQLGLEHRLKASSQSLSGGERQRVALARILAMRPNIIVCDEPTASLDETNSRMVVDYLQKLAYEGALVLCASHDPLVLEHTRQRICLSHGSVTELPEQSLA